MVAADTYRLLLLSCFVILCSSCQHQIDVPTGKTLVASVGDQALYKSDLDQIIHPNTSTQDSVSIATAYIDQWVREKLMTDQANRYFSKDLEIQRLVSEYEGKLLGVKLEEKILAEHYDTVIHRDELISYYNEIKTQFVLSEDIYRCVYVKIKREQDGLSEFRKNWQDESLQDVHIFALAFSEEYHSDTLMWKSDKDVHMWYDSWSQARIDKKQVQTQRDSEYEYFLKIVDQEAKGEISPLAYIEKQLVRMLLHKKRGEILESYKQELYEKALNDNTIKLP